MKARLKRLLPDTERIRHNRWLRWIGPALHHPQLWRITRRGVALGVALGIFFGLLIPVAQIPFSAAAAVALRANIPAAVASTLVTNPVTFAPIYYAAYHLGAMVLGEEGHAQDFSQTPASGANDERNWLERITALGKPLMLGLVILACSMGVLADDNFATIAHAVKEGRTIYDNIKKAIVFIMPTNGGEAGIVLIAILFGMALPLTPVQILWVNMVTAVTLALALSFENAEPDVMRRAPRKASEPILSGFMIWRISFVSMLLALGTIFLFQWEIARGASIEAARTMAVNALVMGEMAYLFNCRYLLAPVRSWQDFSGNPYVLLSIVVLAVIQMAFTYLPFMQSLFGVVALDAAAWALIAGFGVLLFVAVEVEKVVISRIAAQRS